MGRSVCLSVCLSVMRELTSPVIDRVKNKLTYPATDGGQKICGIFSETASLQFFCAYCSCMDMTVCIIHDDCAAVEVQPQSVATTNLHVRAIALIGAAPLLGQTIER